MLLNLVINAEQAMLTASGRGTLVVRTWHDAVAESVVLEIGDDGPGIPEELQPKIFDPFFTTKEVGKGTGLGLTVAYAIVEEHGGRITLRSDPGGAPRSSWSCRSAASGHRQPPARVPAPQATTAVKGAAVLVVEDEPALAAAVADALERRGYLVDRAGDGEQALIKVGERAYDVVICDLKMPRLDGMAFFRALADRAPALSQHIIFVTGDVIGTDAERFLEESGCRWLAKPFRLGDLLRTVKEVSEE